MAGCGHGKSAVGGGFLIAASKMQTTKNTKFNERMRVPSARAANTDFQLGPPARPRYSATHEQSRRNPHCRVAIYPDTRPVVYHPPNPTGRSIAMLGNNMSAIKTAGKIPWIVGGIFFLIANLLFLPSSESGFYSLLLLTFPVGPLCMDLFQHLDKTFLFHYDDSTRNSLFHISSYIILVVGGSFWYWSIIKSVCWLWRKLRKC
jgi:hypothetical protein